MKYKTFTNLYQSCPLGFKNYHLLNPLNLPLVSSFTLLQNLSNIEKKIEWPLNLYGSTPNKNYKMLPPLRIIRTPKTAEEVEAHKKKMEAIKAHIEAEKKTPEYIAAQKEWEAIKKNTKGFW